jgi:hypothetical protein
MLTVPEPPAGGNDRVDVVAETSHLPTVGEVTDVDDDPHAERTVERIPATTARRTSERSATSLP